MLGSSSRTSGLEDRLDARELGGALAAVLLRFLVAVAMTVSRCEEVGGSDKEK